MATNVSLNHSPLVEDQTVDLLELTVTFVSEWRLGLICGLVLFVAGIIVTFMITPLYEAEATILPQQSRTESNSLTAIFSGKGPGDVFVGLLGSRSVADGVIDRANLLSVYKTSSRERARTKLAGSSKITSGVKDTLIKISVKSVSAQEAARIANAYVDSLQAEQELMALSTSTLHRQFFEKQLEHEKEALAAAELELRKQQETSGVVQVDAQTQLGLSAIANKQAQITTLQVELAALLQGSTEQNPQVKTLRSEIAQLEEQERRLESGGANSAGAAPGAGRMPEVNLEYARKSRDVRYHEVLLTSLSSQYQNARLIEAGSEALFQVVDRAVVPERKSWPPRKMFVLVSFAFSMLAGFGAVAIKLFLRRLQQDPHNREHLRAMRRSFGMR
jgi:tyrosine-protein kinase Etk/Wzc